MGDLVSYNKNDLLKFRNFGKKSLTELDDLVHACLLYTSDAADERSSVDLGGRRIIKKKKICMISWEAHK